MDVLVGVGRYLRIHRNWDLGVMTHHLEEEVRAALNTDDGVPTGPRKLTGAWWEDGGLIPPSFLSTNIAKAATFIPKDAV